MPRNRRNDGPFDLDALLDPARAFAHPSDVVNDPDLTLREKRAILIPLLLALFANLANLTDAARRRLKLH